MGLQRHSLPRHDQRCHNFRTTMRGAFSPAAAESKDELARKKWTRPQPNCMAIVPWKKWHKTYADPFPCPLDEFDAHYKLQNILNLIQTLTGDLNCMSTTIVVHLIAPLGSFKVVVVELHDQLMTRGHGSPPIILHGWPPMAEISTNVKFCSNNCLRTGMHPAFPGNF